MDERDVFFFQENLDVDSFTDLECSGFNTRYSLAKAFVA